jgi:RNA polymerase sigma-70 factor (ECF subfamily)
MISQETRPSLLVRLRKHGDEEAWAEFDKLYCQLILRYCRACGLQPADSEDVRQDVMMSLARALPRFRYDRSRGHFRGYLRTTIGNAIKTHFRRAGNRAEEFVTSVAARFADARDSAWDREWMLHHYRTAIEFLRRDLEPRGVQVFNLLLQGQAPAAVAAATGASPLAIQKVRQRLTARLKERVAAQMREENGHLR